MADQLLIAQRKDSIEAFVIEDIRKCLDNDIVEVGLIILTLSAVESISGYYCGKRADRSTFVKFLSSNYFPLAYQPIADRLYPLRNGLFHDYANDGNKFVFFRTRDQGYNHLQPSPTDYGTAIALNREIFATDFLSAWKKLADNVTSCSELCTNVLTRIRDTNRGFLIVREIAVYEAVKTQQDQEEPQSDTIKHATNPLTYSGGTVSYSEHATNKNINR